jgi:cytochrome c553
LRFITQAGFPLKLVHPRQAATLSEKNAAAPGVIQIILPVEMAFLGYVEATEGKHMKKWMILPAILPALLMGPALFAGSVQENWDKHCAKCHGADGKGQTKMGKKIGAKDYTDPKVQAAVTDEKAFDAIKFGFKDKGDKPLMKPTEGLSDQEIKELVAHIRTFKK